MNDFIETFKKIVNIIFDFLQKFLISIFVFCWKVIVFIAQHWLAFLFIFIVLYFLNSTRKDLKYKRKCRLTENAVRTRFGYTIYLTAPIRTGKTTLMSGLSHILTSVLIRLANGVRNKTKRVLVESDFNQIDRQIERCFSEKKNIDETCNYLLENNAIGIKDFVYDPVDRELSYYNMLEDYVRASYSLLTNNYVYSAKETPFYNRITGNYRKKMDFTSMQLKNAYDNEKFIISDYSIILEDEKGLDGNKKESKYMTVAKEDDGFSEFLRIIGNAGRETIYYITTNQEAKRWVSTERNLMTTSILINEMEIIPVGMFYKRFLSLMNKIVQFFYTIAIKLRFKELKRQVYINRPNVFKRLNLKIVDMERRLFSKSVVRYKVSLYDNVDDVGKKNTTSNIYCEEMELYLPLLYCLGNIDTHQYAFIFDELRKKSKVSMFDTMEDTQQLTEEEKKEIVDNLLNRSKTSAKSSSKVETLKKVKNLEELQDPFSEETEGK